MKWEFLGKFAARYAFSALFFRWESYFLSAFKNMVKLFIDDEREVKKVFPFVDEGADGFVVARSYDEAISFMERNCVRFISFDHDLGTDKTGLDVVKWMIEKDLNSGGKFIPEDFDFIVHSANPVGKQNIQEMLGGYLSHRASSR